MKLTPSQLHYIRFTAPVQMAMKRSRTWGSGRPTKRAKRSYRKRRRIFSRRPRRVPRNRLGSSGVPIPTRMFCKLKYHDSFNLAPNYAGGAPLDGYIFRSGLYDPDQSAVGHQPLWRDQLANLYQMYRVHGLKYRIKVVNSNTNQLAMVAVQESHAEMPALAGVDFNTVVERNNGRILTIPGAGAAAKTIKGYVPIGRPWGLTRQGMKADEDFEAAIGSNPTKMAYLNIYGVSKNTSAILNCEIELTFFVELFKRVEVAGS